jgi:TolB protein
LLFAAGSLARLSALLLAASSPWSAAAAQTDCAAGFNCGRIAWIEDLGNGPNGYRLWTMNPDGSQRLPVLQFGPANHNLASGLVYSADSRKLYFSASTNDSFDYNIHSVNADGTGLTSLTNDSCSSRGPFGYGHSLSPDGSQIAFTRACGSGDGPKVWLMNVDGSGQRLLTTSPLVSSDPTADEHGEPHFSPAGTHVVFSSNAATSGSRQIYLSTIDGLSVQALTTLKEFGKDNNAPRFMPDGRIIFASGRDYAPYSDLDEIYRIDADGTNLVRLTNMVGRKFGYSVSPDNSRLLFANDPDPKQYRDPAALYVVRTNGADLIPLSVDPVLYARWANFSPDGTRIGFELGTFNPNDRPYSSHSVNLDGSDRIDYVDPALDIPFRAFGRPDVDGDGVIDGADNCPNQANGYRVAMASDRISNYEIWTTDFNGNAAQRLTNSTAIDADPRFDPSGNRIVFRSNRLSSRNEIYAMNANGSGVTRLTNAAGNNVTPAFSPDGSKITFIASRDGGQRNVYIMNSDGTNPIKLTTNQGFSHTANNPVFNHDGTRIAFDSDRLQAGVGYHDIYTIAPDGSAELRLTTAPYKDSHPSYSRDGSRIVFVSERNGGASSGEIYTMNADGSNQVRVTETPFAESHPVFTPDGAQIVFQADYDGVTELYVVNRDGSGRRRLTDTTGFSTNPTVAPQPDLDGDGIGDGCDPAIDVPTGTGTPVTVSGPGADVTYASVTTAGSTAFTEIVVDPQDLPTGFSLCEACTAWDITTTATYVAPITVCLDVPDSVPAQEFLGLRLLHGENGVFVDRTTIRIEQPGALRQVCGQVDSLSPFALASFASGPLFADDFESP